MRGEHAVLQRLSVRSLVSDSLDFPSPLHSAMDKWRPWWPTNGRHTWNSLALSADRRLAAALPARVAAVGPRRRRDAGGLCRAAVAGLRRPGRIAARDGALLLPACGAGLRAVRIVAPPGHWPNVRHRTARGSYPERPC